MRLLLWIALIYFISRIQRKRMQQYREARQAAEKPVEAQPATPPRPKRVPRPQQPAATDSFASEYAALPEVVAAQQASAAKMEQPVAKTDENDTTTPDFDLRQAIIYSEILKPKFNSDEE